MENDASGWFERRTGLGAVLRAVRRPGSLNRPRWRFIWFNTALMLFVVQGVTGLAIGLDRQGSQRRPV